MFAPRKQKFFRVERFFLVTFGIWPAAAVEGVRSVWCENYSRFLLAFVPVILCIDVLYVFNHNDLPLYDLGDLYINLCLQTALLIRVFTSRSKQFIQQVVYFCSEIHLANYKHHDSETVKIFFIIERRCYYAMFALNVCLMFGPQTYLNAPIITNIRTGAFLNSSIQLESAIYHELPFDYHHNVYYWICVYIFNCFLCYNTSYFIVHFGLFQLWVLIHLVGHMGVLKHELKSIVDALATYSTQTVFFTRDDNETLSRLLNSCIDHHADILRWLTFFKETYGVTMFVNYTYDMVACSVLLLVVTDHWPLSVFRYGALTIVVFAELIGESYAMEQLSVSMEEVGRAVDAVPWAGASLANQRKVLVMVMAAQRPFVFKAAGMFNVNLAAMLSILKTTMSYFFWLKRMA